MYDTDEKLKSFLDTNQLAREQLCLAVLAIDRRFIDVRPRHPRGGPDGARDIEALLNGVQRVFGAVGFVNQANDSAQHKQAAMKKFESDLAEALKQQPRPEAFVFFTNVNFTVGEKDELVLSATAKGLAHAEIYDRERIRIALDSADGLSIRFQYLNIAMSQAEQASFFSRWGNDIQAVISNGLGQVQRSLNRIQFLQEASLPLSFVGCVLELDREYSCQEVGHFRAFALLLLKAPVAEIMGLHFGSSDVASRPSAQSPAALGTESGICLGVCGGQWKIKPPEPSARFEENERLRFEPTSTSSAVGQARVKQIALQYTFDMLVNLESGPRLQDLDDCSLIFLVDQRLAEKVAAIRVYGNEYKLADFRAGAFYIDKTEFEADVPLVFSDAELKDPWVRIRPKQASAFSIRFSEHTPFRFFSPGDVAES